MMVDMPLRVSPQQAADRWETGLGAATQKISEGVDRVTVSPGEKAAAQADVWHQNVTAAKEKFARNSRAVSLEDWRAQTKAAVGNVATGASRKKGKFTDKITPVFAHMSTVLARVDNMPRGSYEQNKQRAIAMMDGMHGYKSPGG
jgi:hypothetical protein